MPRPIMHLCAAILALGTLGAAEPANLLSDEEGLSRVYGGEELVSLATGRDQPLSRAPAVATVITADDIKAMGASDINEVLETAPGLNVSLSSFRFSPVYCIRGICTDFNPQVLMLINGVPITQLYFGGRGEQNVLPVESISRIEIIRGPGSAVYGADAFAGVINVITKSADDIGGTEMGAGVGSFETRAAWILHGGRWAGFDVAATLEFQSTEGDRERIIEVDAQTFFDASFDIQASLAPGPADTRQKRLDMRLNIARKNWRLRLWNWRQYDVGVGPGVALALDPSGRADADNYLADLTYQKTDFVKHWDVTGQLSYMDINTTSRQKLFPPGAVLPIGSDGNINPLNPVGRIQFPAGLIGNPEIFERHLRLDLSTSYTGFDKHRIRLATGYAYADLEPQETKNYGPSVINGTEEVVGGSTTDVSDTPFVFVEREQRRLYYASLQDEWALAPDWDLTAGVRYDHYSDFGNTVNPRLALVWQARHNLTSKLLYGRAFRAPSFAELFLMNNPTALGNPDLKPESINTLELAFEYQPALNLTTALSLFAYRIKDLIRLVPEPGGTSSRAQNAGSQTGYGGELEADWRITDDFRFTGNYAFQQSTYETYEETDEERENYAIIAPHHQAYLRADWDFYPHWSLNTELNWIGDRQRVDGDPRSKLEGYAIVDLTLRRTRMLNRLEFAFSVRNLFDQDAREPSRADFRVPAGSLIPGDFPLAGRSFFAEVRYRF